jgi:hypothetical protein
MEHFKIRKCHSERFAEAAILKSAAMLAMHYI